MNENAAREVMLTVLDTVLRDEPWQDLGMRRRPRYGALVQRFRAGWRVQLEKALLKEMVAVLTAAHIVANVIDRTDVDLVVRLCIDGPGSGRDLWRALGYTSRTEAEQHFRVALRTYSDSATDTWAALMASRVGLADLPDRRLAATLFVGTGTFATTAEQMAMNLQSPK
jgi:hypothetical protein